MSHGPRDDSPLMPWVANAGFEMILVTFLLRAHTVAVVAVGLASLSLPARMSGQEGPQRVNQSTAAASSSAPSGGSLILVPSPQGPPQQMTITQLQTVINEYQKALELEQQRGQAAYKNLWINADNSARSAYDESLGYIFGRIEDWEKFAQTFNEADIAFRSGSAVLGMQKARELYTQAREIAAKIAPFIFAEPFGELPTNEKEAREFVKKVWAFVEQEAKDVKASAHALVNEQDAAAVLENSNESQAALTRHISDLRKVLSSAMAKGVVAAELAHSPRPTPQPADGKGGILDPTSPTPSEQAARKANEKIVAKETLNPSGVESALDEENTLTAWRTEGDRSFASGSQREAFYRRYPQLRKYALIAAYSSPETGVARDLKSGALDLSAATATDQEARHANEQIVTTGTASKTTSTLRTGPDGAVTYDPSGLTAAEQAARNANQQIVADQTLEASQGSALDQENTLTGWKNQGDSYFKTTTERDAFYDRYPQLRKYASIAAYSSPETEVARDLKFGALVLSAATETASKTTSTLRTGPNGAMTYDPSGLTAAEQGARNANEQIVAGETLPLLADWSNNGSGASGISFGPMGPIVGPNGLRATPVVSGCLELNCGRRYFDKSWAVTLDGKTIATGFGDVEFIGGGYFIANQPGGGPYKIYSGSTGKAVSDEQLFAPQQAAYSGVGTITYRDGWNNIHSVNLAGGVTTRDPGSGQLTKSLGDGVVAFSDSGQWDVRNSAGSRIGNDNYSQVLSLGDGIIASAIGNGFWDVFNSNGQRIGSGTYFAAKLLGNGVVAVDKRGFGDDWDVYTSEGTKVGAGSYSQVKSLVNGAFAVEKSGFGDDWDVYTSQGAKLGTGDYSSVTAQNGQIAVQTNGTPVSFLTVPTANTQAAMVSDATRDRSKASAGPQRPGEAQRAGQRHAAQPRPAIDPAGKTRQNGSRSASTWHNNQDKEQVVAKTRAAATGGMTNQFRTEQSTQSRASGQSVSRSNDISDQAAALQILQKAQTQSQSLQRRQEQLRTESKQYDTEIQRAMQPPFAGTQLEEQVSTPGGRQARASKSAHSGQAQLQPQAGLGSRPTAAGSSVRQSQGSARAAVPPQVPPAPARTK